jgi:hypothetical protein
MAMNPPRLMRAILKRFNPDFSGFGRASSPDREESGLSSMAVFVHPLVSHAVMRWSTVTDTRTTPEE